MTLERVIAVVDRFAEWQDSLSAAVWIKLESERWIVYI
jgi:putative SOS response-associated peptidase YedK